MHYFWSYASAPPKECISILDTCWGTDRMGPSAATPSERIVEMMTEKYEWTQIGGIYTPDPADDVFERKKKTSGMFGSF